MLVLEYKAYGREEQLRAVDEAIRTVQFIRNKCLRYWMDNQGVTKYALSAYSAVLAKEFPFAGKLNSMARQAAAERAWSSIARFYAECKAGRPGKKSYPRFKRNVRSVEYKTTGWKLSEDRKRITFTDGNGIGTLKLKGTRDLSFCSLDQIKRVRLIRRADGYYVQFCVAVNRRENVAPTQSCIGLDMGLESFYTDSRGNKVEHPRFLRKAEVKIRRLQRIVSRRKKGGKNREKARKRLAKAHLKVQRQRRDFAVKLARCVVRSNDLVAFEDLPVRNMVRNGHLAKNINDAAWSQFRRWLEYFGVVYGRIVVPVPPQYSSQNCSRCGSLVVKTLSQRTHRCPRCGLVLDRDHNAALNILRRGLEMVGRGTPEPNAWGESGLCHLPGYGRVVSGLVEPGIPTALAVGSVKCLFLGREREELR
jgi:putative transposase